MRIAIVAGPYLPVPPEQYGGIELVVHNLIRGLKEEGHEPILLASGDSKVDCELIPIVDKAMFFPKQKKHLPEFHKKIRAIDKNTDKLLRKLMPRIDLIHSHGFDLLNFKEFPNLTTLHNSIPMDQLDYFHQRRDLYYVSISENQQLSYPDLHYAGVVYNGEDPADFPLNLEPEEYVCFLGRLDRQKNPHLAIELAIAAGIKIKLAGKIDFLGEGYIEEELEKYFKHPLVEYLGELGFEDKVKLLSGAKCNLHPTGFREPFGLTVIEAAYCGTPTMAIRRGSMPELIEDGRSGLLVEDFVEGYHQLQKCFEMDREYIGNRARMLFNYKTMTRQYIKAYENVLNIFDARTDYLQAIRDLTRQSRETIETIRKEGLIPQTDPLLPPVGQLTDK